MARHPLDPILRPRSVAIVGASSDPRKRGFQVVRALGESGFRGAVYPVNPRGGEIAGLPVYPSVAELPEAPDLALVATPAATVPDVLRECGARGIWGAVILAVGFRESGADGAALEQDVAAAAREAGIRVIGPNTSGILNLPHGLNLIGARGVRPGTLSFLVQSGNIALALMTEATGRSAAGVSICVGVGNETDVGFHELLDYLGEDEGTRTVIVYAEGMRDARAFLETAARVVRTTPVVLLKGGRSGAGSAAARSHTGSVSGEYGTFQAGLRQAGVIEVRRTDELFHVGETLAAQPPVEPSRGIAILSDGGGQATLAADTLSEAGIPLAELEQSTRDRLRELLGRAAAVGNPVDLAGRADADPEAFGQALETLSVDAAVGGVLVVGLFGGYGIRFSADLEEAEIRAAGAMAEVMRDAGKALVVHSMFAPTRSAPLVRLTGDGVPVVESLEVACQCVAACVFRGRFLARPERAARAAAAGDMELPRDEQVQDDAVRAWLRVALSHDRTFLTEPEGRVLLGHFGVPVPEEHVCASAAEAAEAARLLGGRVALKVVSRHIPHKTEADGVILDVEGPDAAAGAFTELVRRAARFLEGKDGHDDAISALVDPMLPRPLSELLVGVRRDPHLGPVLTVGAGGVAVEVLKDVSHRVLPIDRDDALEMLSELRTAPLLMGVRGRPAGDLEGIMTTILAAARCLEETPEVDELEVNPLFVYPDRVVAVDARVFLRGGGEREAGS